MIENCALETAFNSNKAQPVRTGSFCGGRKRDFSLADSIQCQTWVLFPKLTLEMRSIFVMVGTARHMPSHCVCSESFTVYHRLTCSHEGYLGMQHSEVGDLLGHMLDETCPNVSLEPTLQPLSDEVLPASAISTRSSSRHQGGCFLVGTTA